MIEKLKWWGTAETSYADLDDLRACVLPNRPPSWIKTPGWGGSWNVIILVPGEPPLHRSEHATFKTAKAKASSVLKGLVLMRRVKAREQ